MFPDSILGFLAKKDSAPSFATLIRGKSESFLIKEGARLALERFHRAANTVPAYKKFLKQNGVNPKNVKSPEDFARVPTTDKKNYIQKFSLEERSPNGNMASHRIIAASSSTTGAPTLWPRGEEQEAEAAAIHEFLFSELYELDAYQTLLVICFPMGIYISGIATTIPSFLTALRHPNLTLLTVGNNKENILDVISRLQNQYGQIILAGHPFFVKDVIETGAREGIRWSKTKVRTFFVSEGFSEEWRRYLARKLSQETSERNLFSIYGSSELLLMAYESPETIIIRAMAERNARLRKNVFQSALVPSLFHYNPLLRYIETNSEGELIFSAWSGVPLIRFNLHDTGAVISKTGMRKALGAEENTLTKKMRRIGWRPWNLPYVTLSGRSDHMLVFYAVNIYPKHVHAALDHKPFLGTVTGKFTMEKKRTARQNQKLVIHIELQANARASSFLRAVLERRITQTLSAVNLEYADAAKHLGDTMRPHIILHAFRDPLHFPVGLKPRYIKA